MPEKEKIYSRQISAPILKRKTSRFGLGQFLGSSGNQANVSSHSYATTNHPPTQHARAVHTHSHPYSHSHTAQLTTSSKHHSIPSASTQPCPIHNPTTSTSHSNFFFSSNSPSTSINTFAAHFAQFTGSSAHPSVTQPQSVAAVSALASSASHSQSHQYLVQCVAPTPSQTFTAHSPLPTLREAEPPQASAQILSTQKASLPPHQPSHTSFHSHFQKHPSAPNLLPPPSATTVLSPSPTTTSNPVLHCTCGGAGGGAASGFGASGSGGGAAIYAPTSAYQGRL